MMFLVKTDMEMIKDEKDYTVERHKTILPKLAQLQYKDKGTVEKYHGKENNSKIRPNVRGLSINMDGDGTEI